jgi:uncharacterized protein YndB with AHSA1/START domain
MLIRRTPSEVFRAFADPELTTKFWFTKSNGKVAEGARLQWEWEMYGVSAQIRVKEVEDDRLIAFEWGDGDEFTTVEFRFSPREDGSATYIEVTEFGVCAHAAPRSTSRAIRMNSRSFGSRARRRHTNALRAGAIPVIGT